MTNGTYDYSFEAAKPGSVPSDRAARMRQFTSDAQLVLETILRYEPPQIPLLAPLPDRTICLAFEQPLPAPVLKQLAGKGYRCRNPPESEHYSDKTAE